MQTLPDASHNFNISHTFEGLLGYFVYYDGFMISDPVLSIKEQKLCLIFYEFHDLIWRRIKRFFFQYRIKDGKLKITIFRIPVPKCLATKIAKLIESMQIK